MIEYVRWKELGDCRPRDLPDFTEVIDEEQSVRSLHRQRRQLAIVLLFTTTLDLRLICSGALGK